MSGPTYLTIGPVATLLKLPRWQLAYLIERGDVPGPSLEVPGRRLFTQADVEQIRQALARRESVVRRHENQSRPAHDEAGRLDSG